MREGSGRDQGWWGGTRVDEGGMRGEWGEDEECTRERWGVRGGDKGRWAGDEEGMKQGGMEGTTRGGWGEDEGAIEGEWMGWEGDEEGGGWISIEWSLWFCDPEGRLLLFLAFVHFSHLISKRDKFQTTKSKSALFVEFSSSSGNLILLFQIAANFCFFCNWYRQISKDGHLKKILQHTSNS